MVLQQYGVEALKLFAHIVIASCICAGVRNFMSRNRRYCSSHVFHEKFICWVYGTNSGIAYRRCGRGGRRRIQKMNTHENCSVRSHHDVATLLDRLLLPTRCYSTPLPAASTTFCAPSSPRTPLTCRRAGFFMLPHAQSPRQCSQAAHLRRQWVRWMPGQEGIPF